MCHLTSTFFAILFGALILVTCAQEDSSGSLVKNASGNLTTGTPMITLMPFECVNKTSHMPSSPSGIQRCEKYQEFENEVHCGESGYPIGYGYRYCRRFYENLDKFTESGKKFVECAAKCLIDRLGKYIDQNFTTCSNLHDYAYDTHPDCYVQCGFCSVITKSANIKAFFSVIELKDLAVRTVLQTGAKCAGVYWDAIKKAAKDVAVTKEDLIDIADRVMVFGHA